MSRTPRSTSDEPEDDPIFDNAAPYLTCDRQFEVIGHGRGYVLRLVQVSIVFELLHVRRERGELLGQLRVLTDLPLTRSYEGALGAPGTYNLSSPTARKQRASLLADLSRRKDIDWLRLLEEFAIRVVAADAEGDPRVWLDQVKPRTTDTHLDVDGLQLTRKHPNMLFGAQDTLKSWTALRILGELSRRGIPVAIVDYELDDEAHATRVGLLYGSQPPPILHLAMRKPVVADLDRLEREFHKHGIQFCVVESVVPAVGVANANDADTASHLIGSLRQLDVGSLLIAHVPKADQVKGNERPFGSQFWHALVRSSWFVDRYYHRKHSLSKPRPSVGLAWTFSDEAVTVSRANPSEGADLADRQSLWERMRDLLRSGPLTPAEVTTQLNAKPETIRKTVQRFKLFTRIEGADGQNRLALAERRYSS
jgi:hypothetical protein